MNVKILTAAVAITAALFSAPSAAQTPAGTGNEFPTQTPGQSVVGVGTMCLNSSGQMAPWFTKSGVWQCAAPALPIVPTAVVRTPLAPAGGATALTLQAGTTAQNVFTANEVVNDCLIVNPLTASDQGIAAAEPIWLSFVGVAVQAAGTPSVPLYPGQGIACGSGLTTPVSWIATTILHKISAFKK